MSLYKKIFIFIIFTFISAIAIGYYIWLQEKTILANFTDLQKQEDTNNFKKIITINSKNIIMLAKDYSYWDEMIKFISDPNDEWATKNIDPSLHNFESDYIYVLNKDFKEIYSAKSSDKLNSILNIIDYNQISKDTPKFYEFFINNDETPIHIVIAPIQPTGDFERITSPQGFIVVGRQWDKKYISELSKITDSEISVLNSSDHNSGQIYFFYDLNGINGEKIFQLKITKKTNLILHFESFLRKELLTISFCAFFMIITFFIFYIKFIGNPLDRIATALKTKKTDKIIDLKERGDEVGKIANLVKSFFDQNFLLEQYMKVIEESTIVSKIDPQGNIVYVNDEFIKVTGFQRDEVLGKACNILNHPENPRDLFINIWETISGGKVWKGIFKSFDKKDQTIYLSTTIIPIFDSYHNISHYVALKQDITPFFDQIKLIESQITDQLTGLPNRVKLLDDTKNGNEFGIAIFDINRFRDINEAYSYEFGDTVIIKIANILREQFPSELKIYRLSADRFAVFNKSDISKEQFNEECQNVVKFFRENQVVINEIPLNIRFRSGVSHLNEKNLMLAELSLNFAEENGFDFICFNDSKEIQNRLKNSLTLTKKIREGLENDRLLVYFQKVVSALDPEFFKIECLFRLRDENQAVLTPHIFLEHAKKAGLYSDISQQVLKKILAFFPENNIIFSVNLTMEDILNRDTTHIIFNLIEKYNYQNRIIFEIVETEEMIKSHIVDQFFAKARDYGCKIAIDDFGSGYSNFEYLIKLKADFIKIDGSLIHNIHKDLNSRIIVKTIVSFAKKLNLKVIAEFIHCEEIFKICRDMGIDYLQGFHIHKPEPIENLRLMSKENFITKSN